jgi:hypothetical protein
MKASFFIEILKEKLQKQATFLMVKVCQWLTEGLWFSLGTPGSRIDNLRSIYYIRVDYYFTIMSYNGLIVVHSLILK